MHIQYFTKLVETYDRPSIVSIVSHFSHDMEGSHFVLVRNEKNTHKHGP